MEKTPENDLFFTQLATHVQSCKLWPENLSDDEIKERMGISFYLFFIQGMKVGRSQVVNSDSKGN